MLAQLLVTALSITLALAQQPGDVADAFISAELVPDGECPNIMFTSWLVGITNV